MLSVLQTEIRMHEWSLAEGVISTAVSVAEENDAENIVEIRIKIGQLQQVEREIFEMALEETAKGVEQFDPFLIRNFFRVDAFRNITNYEPVI